MAEAWTLRLATLDEVDAIDTLMKASIRDLSPLVYDEDQTRSSVEYIGSVDPMLIEDGTYFVIEADGELVACGGWSRRDKLFTGSGEGATDARLLDPATETGRIPCSYVQTGHAEDSVRRSSRHPRTPPWPRASARWR